MKNKLTLFLTIITLVSCSKEDIIEIEAMVNPPVEVVETATASEGEEVNNSSVDETNEPQPNKKVPSSQPLYKESYFNQKSGIVFRWGDFRPDSESNMNIDMGTIKGWFAGGQAYHDIDNDGLQDILVTYHLDENNSSTDWYLNQGDDKTFRKIDLINSSTNGLSSHKILKTDVNNDDLADFILLGVDEREAGNYGGNFTVLLQTEDNRFDVISIDDGKGLWYHNGAAGDLNNDGFVDVVTATYIWLGDGTGNFTNTNISLHDYNINPALTYEIIDINNDGFNDIVGGATEVYSFTSGIVLGKQNGFDTTNQVAFLPITNSIATNDLEFLDVDNDGDLDILEIKGYEGNGQDSTITRVLLYVNNNLNFTLDETMFEESIDGGWIHDSRDKHGWGSFKIDDIDGDGIDDIVAENHADGIYNGLKFINNKWKKYRF